MTASCRDIARAVAGAGLDPGARTDTNRVAEHLSGCPPCAAFELQLTLVTEAVRNACRDYEAEAPPDFEVRLLRSLCS